MLSTKNSQALCCNWTYVGDTRVSNHTTETMQWKTHVKRRVLDIRNLQFRSNIRSSVVCRASTNVSSLSIIVMVICRLSITKHTHNTREGIRVPWVGVCIQEDSNTLELVYPNVLEANFGEGSRNECLPTLPNTGPGCARVVVNHIAMPSPNKWLVSPPI